MNATGHVLVLGKGIRAFLAVIRSLGRGGLTVHTGMCPPDDPALKSKYAKHHHDIPEYEPNSTAWLGAVLKAAKQYKFDLIIPTHDESVIPIQLHKDELRPHAGVYALDDETFSIAFDKLKCSFLAEELGICIPRQLALPIGKLNNIAKYDFQLPLMVKPPSSYTSDDLGSRREVVAIRDEYQLSEFAKNNTSWGTALIQEIFEGQGVGVEVLARNGKILTAFQHLRVHEPLSGGASSYRKSTPINAELLLATEKLIGHLNYTGVAMVEYKVNPETGKWIFIEINGRFWGSLPLAVAAGADFPYFLYRMLVLEHDNFPRDHKIDIYCRNIIRDLYWFTDNLRDRLRSNSSPLSIPLHHVLLEATHLIRGKEHIDSFALDDPRPGLAEAKEFLSLFVRKILSVITGQLNNSYPCRWYKARQLRKAALNSRSILFLCYGNICRSPFAEHYARTVLPNSISITSSGFHLKDQRQAPQPATQTAKTLGINTENHRSKTVSDSDIKNADIILAFDYKNMKMMKTHYPHHMNKTFLLGNALTSGPEIIDDPYGGDISAFENTFKRITTAVDEISGTII